MSTRLYSLFALVMILFVGIPLQASPNRTVTLNGEWKLRYWPQPDIDEAITNPNDIE